MNEIPTELLGGKIEPRPGIDFIKTSLLSPREIQYLSFLLRDVSLKKTIHKTPVRSLKNPGEIVVEKSNVLEFTDSDTEHLSNQNKFQSEGPQTKMSKLPRFTANIVKDALSHGYHNCFEYSAVQCLLAAKSRMLDAAIVPYSDYGSAKKTLMHKLGFHDHYGILFTDPVDKKRYVMSFSGIRYPLDGLLHSDNLIETVNQYISPEGDIHVTEQQKRVYASDLLHLVKAVRDYERKTIVAPSAVK